MESLSVHSSGPPLPERQAPSLVPSAVASPTVTPSSTRPASPAREPVANAKDVNGDNDDRDERITKAADASEPLAELPVPPHSPPILSSSRKSRSPRAQPASSPIADELAPLPDFDVDAPPAVAPVEMDKELEIQHKDEEEELEPTREPAEDGVANDEAQHGEFDGMQVDAAQSAGMPELSGYIGDIQDIPDQDYDAYDLQAEVEPEPAPDSPREITLSPLTDLPTELGDVEPLSISEEVSAPASPATSSARALRQNGALASVANSAEERGETPETLIEVDEEPPSKPKRKGGKAAGPASKRVKKSSKPRRMVDEDLGVARDVPKPQERTQPRAKSMTDQRLQNAIKGQTTELQCQPCLRDRYMPWGKCVQCIAKIGGDSCRFRNYRRFPIDPVTGEITGKGIFPSTELEGELTPLPRQFNTTLTEEHILRTEQTVAPMLVSLITAELRHVVNNQVVTRPVDTAQHRAVCDFCAGTIFGGFFFCTRCGRDYCLLCERYMSHTNDDLLDSPWPIPANVRPRLQKCSRAPDSELPLPKSTVRTGTVKYNHSLTDLQAVSRFTEEQLRTTWVSLVNFVLQPGDDVDVEERLAFLRVRDEEDDLRAAVREWFESHKGKRQRSSPSQSTPSEDEIKALYDASVDLPQVEDPAELGSQPFLFIENDRLDNATFDQLWARGEPLVVNKVTANMRLTWNPELFIERFGPEQCYVLNCKTEKVSTMTIGQFFTLLGDHTRSKVYTPPYVPPPPSPPAAPRAAGARQSSRARKAVTYTAPEENDDSRERENAETGSQRGGTPASARRAGSEASGPANGNGNREEGDEDVDNLPPPRKITKSVLKLKDWPCTNDFSTAYPELYEDFCRALPVPDFTGRNGVLNLYSHFPAGATRPDIGPKMYNAFAAQETTGGQGSTRMHMDVADAVNIMMYAADREDGTPGCAVWDLFRAEDGDKIRAFLSTKFAKKAKFFTDPIHSQMFYLDSKLRNELYRDQGVKSFRVYQYPGQAVFIPAGCAHQVCNLADCIKIALDFVSPHNVRRCQQLTQDFRRENFALTKAWKDDVLQLYNVMWYAWTNVRETRERRAEEAAKEEAEKAKRKTQFMSSYTASRQYHNTSSVRDDPTPSPLGTDRGTPGPLATDGDKDKDGGSKSNPTSNVDSPPDDLIRKLMGAALTREHRPVHIDAEDAKHASASPQATPEPESEPAPKDEKPVRLSEQIAAGHIPSELALQVLQSQMGMGGGEPIDVE